MADEPGDGRARIGAPTCRVAVTRYAAGRWAPRTLAGPPLGTRDAVKPWAAGVKVMRKAKLVIGQDVYSLADGARVETVKDVLVDETEDVVVGLLIDAGGLLSTSKVVPMGAVTSFGPSAVMIGSSSAIVSAESDPGVSQMLTRGGSLIGNRVLSEDGTHLGSIADLYFDEATARITGYEVSGVSHGEIMGGSLYLPIEEVRVVGSDAVVVSTAILERTRRRPMPPVASEPSDGDGDAERQDPRELLVGSRLRADLIDADGSVVAANGQLVTAELVDTATENGNLEPLYSAAGVERGQAPTEQAIADASATAADLWARFTGKLAEMTDTAGQRLDAQQTRARLDRINDSIGRPVTKVFLDRDDSVILDLGDLVTHQAIQRAADAGLLESLLDSVYTAPDVTFSREEMRAGIGGDSTLDQASGGASVVTELEDHLREVEEPQERQDEHPDGATERVGVPVEASSSAGRP